MTTGHLEFAISIPQFVPDATFDPAGFRAYLGRAEELGFRSGWTAEQVLGSMPHLGPVETLSYAAACTERLRLGCAVFVTPLHSPLHLAKSISSLGVERVRVSGRPGDVAAGLARIAAAGTELILLNPLSGEAEQMERLAAEVIPQLA